MCTPTQGVWQPAGCVSCELVCVCVSFVRVVIICPASTHTALVSSPSLTVVHLSTYIHTHAQTPTMLWRGHMLMILARLVCSESFWAVVEVRSPHTGPEVWHPRHVHVIRMMIHDNHLNQLSSQFSL